MKSIYGKELLSDVTTISAMELRREPGRILDRAELGNETIVVERAGRPKAAIVPLRELEEMRRIRRLSRERFFMQTAEMKERFSDLSTQEINTLVNEAVEDVRTDARKAA